MYTTHGYMTPADIADHQRLTDTGPHPHCPGHADADGPYVCSAAENCPDEEE